MIDFLTIAISYDDMLPLKRCHTIDGFLALSVRVQKEVEKAEI